MDAVLKWVFSESGLAGIVILGLVFAIWKLYRDLRGVERVMYVEAIKQGDRYRDTLIQTNTTILQLEKVLDKALEIHRR